MTIRARSALRRRAPTSRRPCSRPSYTNWPSAPSEITYGDVTDFSNFGGAVIDRRSFNRLAELLARLRDDPHVRVVAGGTVDDREGLFVRPTVITSDDPHHEIFTTEFFGPILAVYAYPDADFDAALQLVDRTSPYALTGALFATDRSVITHASHALRFSAGTSTSTTSPPAPSWASSPSEARAPRAPMTRPGRSQPRAMGLAADDQGDLRRPDSV